MRKEFKFALKTLGEDGTFTGLGAVYGNVDLGGDVIEPGAFTRTLAMKGGEVPVLWQHDMREPIGLGKLTDTKDGLQIDGELVLESPVAQKAYALLKKHVLKGLSIGYDAVREEMKGTVRHLKEIKLYEVSLVTFPMNEMALVSGVKDMSVDEVVVRIEEMIASAEREKKEFQALVDRYAALKAPSAPQPAKQEPIAPDLHALDTILQHLRGQ
jgi:HK97 family phage prohead protease